MEAPPGFTGLANMDAEDLISFIVTTGLVLLAVAALLLLSVILATGAGAAAAKYRSVVKASSRISG